MSTYGQRSWFRVGPFDLDRYNRYWLIKIGRLAIMWERKIR